MRFSSSVFISAIVLCLAAACGGGGGAAIDSGPAREPFVPIVADPVVLPTGSARYTGDINLGFAAPRSSATVSLTGDLSLTVDFDQPETAITGGAQGFADDTTAYSGALFVDGGTLEDLATRPTFAAQVSGALQGGGASYLIFGQMNGEVLGTSQEAILGQITGTAREAGLDASVAGQFQASRALD